MSSAHGAQVRGRPGPPRSGRNASQGSAQQVPALRRKARPASAQRQGFLQSREGLFGVLLVLLGGGTLAGLFKATLALKADTLLVVSNSIYNVISGLRGIALGMGQILLGMGQMLALAALALLSVTAVLAMVSGAVRICRNLLPALGFVIGITSTHHRASRPAPLRRSGPQPMPVRQMSSTSAIERI